MPAVLATRVKGDRRVVTGPYQLSAADSVDGLLYMPDASNPPSATTPGLLIVAAGNVLCGWLERKGKIGDKLSLVITGSGPAVASGVIAAYGAVKCDSAGKCAAGTVGTDHIIGFNDGKATGQDGDRFTLRKLA
jgi:hypothetical protein